MDTLICRSKFRPTGTGIFPSPSSSANAVTLFWISLLTCQSQAPTACHDVCELYNEPNLFALRYQLPTKKYKTYLKSDTEDKPTANKTQELISTRNILRYFHAERQCQLEHLIQHGILSRFIGNWHIYESHATSEVLVIADIDGEEFAVFSKTVKSETSSTVGILISWSVAMLNRTAIQK